MTFEEALEYFKRGDKIGREDWGWALYPDFTLTMEDLTAKDWVVYPRKTQVTWDEIKQAMKRSASWTKNGLSYHFDMHVFKKELGL